MGQKTSTQRNELKKSIIPIQAWALAVGAIIGWGCFMLPGTRFLPESGPGASLIGLALGCFAMSIVALSYAIMLKAYPIAGGAFIYAFVGFGRIAAVICGWGLALSYSCVIALNATAILLLTRFLLPGAFEIGHLYSIAGWDIYAGEGILISSIVLFFGLMNYKGSNCASNVQLTLSVLLAIGVVVLAVGSGVTETASIQNMQPYFNEKHAGFISIITVVSLAPFLYQGFDTIPQTAEEFSFDHNKSAMLMIVSIICGCALYSLVLFAVSIIRPYPEMLAAEYPWLTGTVANMAFGKAGGIILAVPVLTGIFSGINGYFIATTRLLFSMGRSKFIPAWFEKIHPKTNTPSNAIIFVLGFALIAPWFGRQLLVWLTDTCALTAALSYFFTCYAAFKFVSLHPEQFPRASSKYITILGSLISICSVLLLIFPGSPAAISNESWILLIFWCFLGFIFYRMRVQELNALPLENLKYLLIGECKSPLLFKSGK